MLEESISKGINGYFSGYQPKEILKQWEILKEYFPTLKISKENLNSNFSQEFYPKAEGQFLIPDWHSIAPTYGHAVVVALNALLFSLNGKFKNYREGKISDDYLRQSWQSVAAWQNIRKQQKGDVLLVSAQFGLNNTDISIRSSREAMEVNEFGLGLFHTTMMLITHPERLSDHRDLYIDCAGDEFVSETGKFSKAPCFCFDFRVFVEARAVSMLGSGYGSPTFFIEKISE
jgi:hypothetical protein